MARHRPARDDIADLRCFAAVLAAHRAWWIETGQPAAMPLKALRECLWFYWEAPRRPGRPSKLGAKYSTGLLWSPAARAIHDAGKKGEVINEHREPVNLVLKDLLAVPSWELMALRAVIEERVQTCVITTIEDKMINTAGFAQRMPPGDDPWRRYRLAGLDFDAFAPLEQ